MANRPELKVTLCQYARNAVAHRALSTWFAIQEGPSSFAIFDTLGFGQCPGAKAIVLVFLY
jgi:hypothetical protein